MDPINLYFILIFLLPGYIVFVSNIIWDVYFWQTKDFRFDRMYSHIRYDHEPSHRSSKFTIIKILAFILLSLFLWWPTSLAIGFVAFCVYAIYVIEAIYFIERLKNNPDVHSVLTTRSLVTIVVSVLMGLGTLVLISLPLLIDNKSLIIGYQEFLLGISLSNTQFTTVPSFYAFIIIATLVLITLDLGSPLISTVGALIGIPFSLIKRFIILQTARNILNSRPNLDIVGITGSVGKSTTAHILYQLIEGDFSTVRAPASYTTNLNIAKALFDDVNPNTDVLIAELGSYRRGELKMITDFIPLDIAIVTNIEYAHIGVHRHQSQIFAAKKELIDGLKPDGIAILNSDDEYCRKLAGRNQGNEIMFFTDEGLDSQKLEKEIDPVLINYVQARNVKMKNSRLEFDLRTNNNEIHIKTTSRHKGLIHSYLAAIATALALGVDIATVQSRLAHVRVSEHDFTPTNGTNGAKIIDSTSTLSYSQLLAALKELKTESGNKRVVITKGIPELGEHKAALYHKLSEHFHAVDLLITSDRKLAKAVRAANAQIEIIIARSNDDIIYQYRREVGANDLVLLAGPLSTAIMEALVSKK